jgi:GT2 family glycosyltransferase
LLLNPDTLVPDGALAACVAFLDAQPPTVGGMTCRVESPDGSLQHECARRLPTPWSEVCRALLLDRLFANVDLFNRERFVGWDKRDARPVPAALGAFLLLRSEAVRVLPGGLLDENFFLMYEDVDLCKRLGDAGHALWYWPGARIVHLGGQSTRQRPVQTYATSHRSALVYFHKHHLRAVPFVRAALRVGMELKIGLLRLDSLRRPNDEWIARHLAMARAARTALRGSPTGAPAG